MSHTPNVSMVEEDQPQNHSQHSEPTKEQLKLSNDKSSTLSSQHSNHGMAVLNSKQTANPKTAQRSRLLQLILDTIGVKKESQKRETTTRELGKFIWLTTLFVLFVMSIAGFCIMWFTEYYNNAMLEKIVLAEGSETAKSWANPDPKYDTLLKVHIFNYTNIEEFLAGEDEKLRLEDLGPLTYQEHTTKTGVVFNKNHTVTFRDHRTYKLLPEKSSMSEDDIVVLPNVPLLTASVFFDKMGPLQQLLSRPLINSMNEKPFKPLTAGGILWGYPDKIVKLDFGTGNTQFGLLMNRNGTSVDWLQINTGVDDLRKFSTITQFNGMPLLDFWEGESCNRIDGSDASMFPPHLIEQRQTLSAFLQVLCRKVPLHFERELTILKNIDVLRYRTALDVFDNPANNSANECYCRNTERCLPSGVINATKCYNGAPIYPSFPHFLAGDPVIYKDFEGIHPDAELHQTYADVHPRFAFPISGASRIQINIALHKSSIVKGDLKRLAEGTILPLIWIEITSGDFSEETIDTLFVSTFGLNAIELALKYGTLVICLISLGLIAGIIYYLLRMRRAQSKQTEAEIEALNAMHMAALEEIELTA